MAAAAQKTVTKQTRIGEAGIALIHQRAVEMGFLFHPRRVDHGIDGHLDLVDARSGALLSLTILVQSKASELPFAGEDDAGFHYMCKPQDLDLWLAGNAPVVVVAVCQVPTSAWTSMRVAPAAWRLSPQAAVWPGRITEMVGLAAFTTTPASL